ncbi:MAG: hypothetical protein IT364_13785 [Candidatus Hydrogenedentes bacterium]|nr:hypothetical protein [Candidatus Hydrogenedentota bacterium]
MLKDSPDRALTLDALKGKLITWAALFAQYYCKGRRDGGSMVEACDDADYMCSSLFFNDAELLEEVPDVEVESLKPVFRAARDAAIQAFAPAYDEGLRENYAALASRMNEYVFGNPAPWSLGE